MKYRYLVALGSNMRHVRHGPPERVLAAACAALEEAGFKIKARSPVIRTAPLGSSRRRYANGAVVLATKRNPAELLTRLKRIEQAFGPRRAGRRWGARVLDIDIVLWSGGAWNSPGLTVPHTAFRTRTFVLRPAAAIAARWRDPLTGLTVRHLLTRLTRPHPAPR